MTIVKAKQKERTETLRERKGPVSFLPFTMQTLGC